MIFGLIEEGTEEFGRFNVRLSKPLTNGCEVLILHVTDQLGKSRIREIPKNPSVNPASSTITLELINNTSPIRKVCLDDFSNDRFFIRNRFSLEDSTYSLHKLFGKRWEFRLRNLKFDNRASRMERLNNPIDKITSKNESTICTEFLHKVTQSWLCGLWIQIVGLIEDYHLSTTHQGHGASKLRDVVTQHVDVTIHRTVDNDVVTSKLFTHGFCHSRLTNACGARENEIRNVLLIYELLKCLLEFVSQDSVGHGLWAILLDPQKIFKHNISPSQKCG